VGGLLDDLDVSAMPRAPEHPVPSSLHVPTTREDLWDRLWTYMTRPGVLNVLLGWIRALRWQRLPEMGRLAWMLPGRWTQRTRAPPLQNAPTRFAQLGQGTLGNHNRNEGAISNELRIGHFQRVLTCQMPGLTHSSNGDI
jgi:hypothetical protein